MSLIDASDVWTLWAIVIAWASVSIYLERRYRWAAVISGAVIALLGAILLVNLRIIPSDSSVYDNVWNYAVPLAVPLLLFEADLRKIWKESGRSFGAFHISALGTMLGAMIATLLLSRQLPEVEGVCAMFTASYIGGSVNYAAMKQTFAVSSDVASAGVVADNLLMALYFLVLMTIPGLRLAQKYFPHTVPDQNNQAVTARAANPMEHARTEMSLQDIAMALAVAATIVAVSLKIATFITNSSLPAVIKMFLGQKYLLITTVTVVAATACPQFFQKIKGSKEIGTFFIYLFFVVIGIPASIPLLIQKSPVLFFYAAIIVSVNLVVTLALGKWCGLSLEELLICSNANIGGPTTAAAMAVAKGWHELVIPALLVGVWGYAIGNYCGIMVAWLMASWLAS